jgi:glycosyltransferase involved in cell wall biosynthesis
VRITYDHRIFAGQPFGGIARYFSETAARVAAEPGFDVTVLAVAHLNHYLRAAPARVVRGAYVPHVRGTGRMRVRFNDAVSRAWLRRSPPDLLHETYYAATSLAPARTPTVLTVYDMIHEKLPQLFARDDPTAGHKATAVHRAERVICISESTRRDLLEHVSVDPAKVSVVHLANSLAPSAAAAPLVAEPYLLYVGQRGAYKNFGTLLDAFATSRPLRSAFRLVAFGGGPFTATEAAQIRRLRLDPRAVRHVAGGDEVLTNLYGHAAAFVYPSLYEGFGIPLLEAMAAGCPVACSDVSSFPEVAAGAAELFDPTDAAAVAGALERVVLSPARTAELRELGRAQAARFSWDRCATETAAVYRSLGGAA